jgi:hypothetical protein
MASGGSTMVEHSTKNLEIKGSNTPIALNQEKLTEKISSEDNQVRQELSFNWFIEGMFNSETLFVD